MKFDSSFRIVGERIILIPYKETHVEKYHGWMSDGEILRLTGSESLTFEQEQEMQKEWEPDSKKCTFIIMDRSKYEECHDEIASIVGDTNLFFELEACDHDHCDEACTDTVEENNGIIRSAEIEVMVAEPWARRKGLAKEALGLMMRFGTEKLGKTKFIAKIKCDNEPSIQLFQKLGFRQVTQPNIFDEISFELNCL